MSIVKMGISLHEDVPASVIGIVRECAQPIGSPRGDYQRYLLQEYHAREIQRIMQGVVGAQEVPTYRRSNANRRSN